ncbi:MAG: hypothetical protein JWR78_4727 [Mycobacterium sp.]|nr:hypothetical protein [Mycobacterium sp.]
MGSQFRCSNAGPSVTNKMPHTVIAVGSGADPDTRRAAASGEVGEIGIDQRRLPDGKITGKLLPADLAERSIVRQDLFDRNAVTGGRAGEAETMAITDVPAFAHLPMQTSRSWQLSWRRSAGTSRIPGVSATHAISAARSPRSGPLRWRAGSCWPRFEAILRAESGNGLLELFADIVETIRF